MNVILGIYWLYANQVYIGCKENVIFIPPKIVAEGEVIFALLDIGHRTI